MKQQKLIVVIDQACIDGIKNSGNFELVLPDRHQSAIAKLGKKACDYKPELVHSCLLMLLDSPLNKEGKLKIYVRTIKNIIIKISKTTRIPRTFNRFCGLMSQLLQKHQIVTEDGESKVLMKLVRPPISMYFPENAIVYGVTKNTDKIVSPESLIPNNDSNPAVFVISATDEQNVMLSSSEFVKREICLSHFEMSSEFACFKLCKLAFQKWIEANEK